MSDQDDLSQTPEATIEEIAPVAIQGDEDEVLVTPVGGADRGLHLPNPHLRATASGIAAVGVKELRGRMRGRRAFVIITIYLLMLGGFAWMVEVLMERSFQMGFGNSAAYASASIGQGIFAAIMMLETLQVVFLAPASTAGGISLEREKQTLDMLITTPITSVAIVVGKLLSALIYVFLLIAASIPLTAVVFVYGGVAPDDVLRGYAVLLATALGLGAFGLFCSSLVKRTQAATAISIFGVLAISIGSLFLLIFWAGVSRSGNGEGLGPVKGDPPQVVAWVNPFIAQADVICGTDTSFGWSCSIVNALVPNQNGVVFIDQSGGGFAPPVAVPVPAFGGNEKGGVVVVDDVAPDIAPGDIAPFGPVRDAFWPKTVVTWLVLSVVFLLASVQLVSPTRRWRPHLPRRASKGTPA
jgi:ABC-type transport system involved in multi-copper enzyme maturation permease subunit